MSADVEIALSEFQALRAEIASRHEAQSALLGICLTAVGVAFGLVLSRQGASEELLLIVPVVCAGLGFFYANHNRVILLIGGYIRVELWPRLAETVGTPHLMSWEEHVLGFRSGRSFAGPLHRLRYMALELFGGATVFVLPGAVALAVFGPGQALAGSGALFAGWLLDVAMMVMHITATLLLVRDYAQT